MSIQMSNSRKLMQLYDEHNDFTVVAAKYYEIPQEQVTPGMRAAVKAMLYACAWSVGFNNKPFRA